MSQIPRNDDNVDYRIERKQKSGFSKLSFWHMVLYAVLVVIILISFIIIATLTNQVGDLQQQNIELKATIEALQQQNKTTEETLQQQSIELKATIETLELQNIELKATVEVLQRAPTPSP